MDYSEYTFEHLNGMASATSMAYLIGLVDSRDHKICDPIIAKRILGYLYDIEEQAPNPAALLESQNRFFLRFFQNDYRPQTPCMLTRSWSPIAAMLERGFEPLILKKDDKIRAVASGIWDREISVKATPVDRCTNFEELFWAVLAETARRAREYQLWISVIAAVGWDYDTKIRLPSWSQQDVAKTSRILWRRTPEG